mgnify:CR=1 FL=1
MHALPPAQRAARARRIAITAAPRFGIVGQTQTISYRLDDQGVTGERARVTIRRDGEVINERTLSSGQAASVDVDIKHAGPNIVEIEASPLERELTPVNNRAVVAIDGVRDKLRVLLVSGEPHSGERTWRNLLKSDASVDLVHFTILRPPEKQDGTPINELSLIAFPTRELFQQKINEFQLIIFDRYARQGVLPIAYFDNIARYVRAGGAVLVSAGPDYASTTSIWRTPLDTVLPAEPVGVTEKPGRPHAHPTTPDVLRQRHSGQRRERPTQVVLGRAEASRHGGDVDLVIEVFLDVVHDLVERCDHGLPFRCPACSSGMIGTRLFRTDSVAVGCAATVGEMRRMPSDSSIIDACHIPSNAVPTRPPGPPSGSRCSAWCSCPSRCSSA